MIIDLHTHTTFSDGMLSPEELFNKAKKADIKGISITDHDTIDGNIGAAEMAARYGLDYITGIELSCFDSQNEYHILGYGIDIDNEDLHTHLAAFKQSRVERAEIMTKRLNEMGMKIDFNDIVDKAGVAPITRPHIAQVIVESGYVSTTKDAFNLYIGDGGPAYAVKAIFQVEKAIKLINNSGGIAVIAHPGYSINQKKLFQFIESGLDGIEVNHPLHNDKLRKEYHAVASQYWLLETGGSDFHGNRPNDSELFGKEGVSIDVMSQIRKRCR
ncbi:MAG: PHP domain-containing protein [Ignavibacteria bacterium]|jgi:predicted metal-dependent phosphoesterase TrpH|nr:PHP domain-containing protein [Ignavibacteria bacterium]